MIYGRRWPLGTQGKMYLATDVNDVMVTEPLLKDLFNYCSFIFSTFVPHLLQYEHLMFSAF